MNATIKRKIKLIRHLLKHNQFIIIRKVNVEKLTKVRPHKSVFEEISQWIGFTSYQQLKKKANDYKDMVWFLEVNDDDSDHYSPLTFSSNFSVDFLITCGFRFNSTRSADEVFFPLIIDPLIEYLQFIYQLANPLQWFYLQEHSYTWFFVQVLTY